MVNEELLVRNYLAADSGVAAIASTRIYTQRRPGEPTFPLVVVRRIGGGADGVSGHVDSARIQIDVWGLRGDGPNVNRLFRAVRDAMKPTPFCIQHALGIVSRVDEANALSLDDPASEAEQIHYLADYVVVIHPAPPIEVSPGAMALTLAVPAPTISAP